MNIDNISEGMEVKNYRELCRLLEEKQTTGCSRRHQIEQWERYFSYEKKGQKFIIKNIYNEPLPDVSKIRSLYTGIIELLVMDFLSQTDNEEIFISRPKLYQKLGIASKKYFDYKREYHENPDDEIYDTYAIQRIDSKLNDILTSALESMAKRWLISYRYEYVVHEKIDSGDIVCRSVTAEEERDILEVNHNLLVEYGNRINNSKATMQDIYARGMISSFYRDSEKRIKEKHNTWENYYRKLRIVKYNEGIKRAIPIQQDEIKKLSQEAKKVELNSRVCDALKRQMETKKSNYWEKNGWMLDTGMTANLPIPVLTDNFCVKQDKFIDTYVKLDSDDIFKDFSENY